MTTAIIDIERRVIAEIHLDDEVTIPLILGPGEYEITDHDDGLVFVDVPACTAGFVTLDLKALGWDAAAVVDHLAAVDQRAEARHRCSECDGRGILRYTEADGEECWDECESCDGVGWGEPGSLPDHHPARY